MIYKAIADGNFSTLAIWQMWNGTAWINATVLPSLDDDVYSNNFIVTITSDVSVNSFNRSSLSSPAINQGGQFQITGANEITLSGQVNGSNANLARNNPLSACVNRLVTHINKFHRIGDDVGGNNSYCYGFFNNSGYDIDLMGSQIGGSSNESFGFYNVASSTFNSIIGNQTGGSGTSCFGFYNVASSTFNSIIGNQTGGSGSSCIGFYNAASSTFNSIIGNQTGGVAHGFYNVASSTFNSIIGNQTGGVTYGFYNTASSTFNSIIGNQTGGSGVTAYGFCNTAINSNIKIKGISTASGVAAIANTQASSYIYFEGSVINNVGVMAIFSPNIYLNVNPDSVWKWSNLIGDDQYLYGAGHQLGNPLNRDVRKDTNFGPNDELIGTLAVAPPEAVNLGVPTDDTVGTWAFDDDLIERLKHCATTEIVDVQLASYQNT